MALPDLSDLNDDDDDNKKKKNSLPSLPNLGLEEEEPQQESPASTTTGLPDFAELENTQEEESRVSDDNDDMNLLDFMSLQEEDDNQVEEFGIENNAETDLEIEDFLDNEEIPEEEENSDDNVNIEDFLDDDYSLDDDPDYSENTENSHDEGFSSLDIDDFNDDEIPLENETIQDQEDDEEFPEENDDSTEDSEEKTSFGNKLKNRFRNFKNKVKSEMGDDESEENHNADNEEEEEVSDDFNDDDDSYEIDDEEDRPKQKKGKNKGKSSNPIKKIWKFISGIYNKIHHLSFKILLAILNPLSKLPFIGKQVKPYLEMTRVLKKISHFLPIFFIVIVWFAINYFYTSSEKVFDELPDEAEITISEMNYDENNNTITYDMENTGEVISEVYPEFIVYSTQFGWNPITWFVPQEVVICEGDWVDTDIDGVITETIECSETNTKGFWFRVHAEDVHSG